MPDLKFHFLAPEVTRDLRRAFILSLIGSSLGMRQHEHMLRAINQMAAAHVFDMGRLFDLNNPDCIKNDVGIKLLDQAREFQIGAGLRLPHQKTLFLSRGDKPGFQWGFWACYAVEDAGLITINTFLYESSHKQWSWAGFSVVDCIDHSKSQPHQSGQLSQLKATVIYDQGNAKSGYDRLLLGDPITATMLLLQKSDVVVVQPAPWWPSGEPPKLKAFQTPNPSVSVVKVNTSRIIVRPPRDDDGNGATVRPHDRRSHLRRRGNKIIVVREAKIHGGAGAGAATAKVVKIERPV